MQVTEDFDPSKLDELKDYRDENNNDLRISIVEVYIAETTKLISALKMAADDKSFSDLSHSLKSSTASVGGAKLSQVFAELEQNKLSHFEKVKALKTVEQLFADLQLNLKSYLKQAA